MFPWGAFITYSLVAAYTPGPNNIISLTNGSRMGWKRGIRYNLGQMLGLIIQMNACIFACRVLNALLPSIAPYMSVVGAVYILYLAWKVLRMETMVEEGESSSGFWYGVGMQFLNPKTYLSVFAIAQAYLLPHYAQRGEVLFLFSLGMTLNAVTASLCWLFGGSVFRRVFNRHGKLLSIIMALLLVYCAVSLFL